MPWRHFTVRENALPYPLSGNRAKFCRRLSFFPKVTDRMTRIVLFDDYERADEVQWDLAKVAVRRLIEPGPLLDISYELLLRVFDPAVLDTKDTYISLLSPDGLRSDGFPPICLAAAIDHGANRVVVGFVSASLMWIDEQSRQVQLAIGNIATSPRVKSKGLRGVGSALWNAAVEFGAGDAKHRMGDLLYSVAEAEPDSLGFWSKLGYRRPDGVQYLQPPLEFDEEGRPVHEEVPETFVVLLLTSAAHTVSPLLVRRMILAVYRNWCVGPNRAKLSPLALKRVEEYVLGSVFGKVSRSFPQQDQLPLRPLELSG